MQNNTIRYSMIQKEIIKYNKINEKKQKNITIVNFWNKNSSKYF